MFVMITVRASFGDGSPKGISNDPHFCVPMNLIQISAPIPTVRKGILALLTNHFPSPQLMPNPLTHNDEAAQFVAYYASPAMESDLVRRLHSNAASKKRLEQQNAATKTAKLPLQTRTPAEIEAYAKQAVYDEMNRRERHKAALEAEMYGALRQGHKDHFASPSEQEAHLKQLYVDPFNKMVARRAESSAKCTYRHVAKDVEGGEKERWWRYPNVPEPPFPGRAYLVSDAPLIPSAWRKTGVPADLEERRRRWSALARPLNVTPKVNSDPKPEFTIYSKFRVAK